MANILDAIRSTFARSRATTAPSAPAQRQATIHRPPTVRDAYAGLYGYGTGGGFAAAAINRLTASMATYSQSINADLDGNLAILRARGRAMANNNEHGKRFLSQCAGNIVGPAGPTLQVRAYNAQRDINKPATLDKPANDAIEIHYARWARSADIAGRMGLAHLYRVLVKAIARDGEGLLRIVRNRNLPYGIALQLLDVDRLDETLNQNLSNGHTIRQGVEIDSTGRPIACYVKTRHPGEQYGVAGRADIERVPVGDLIHAFLQERAEQVRGVTWMHAVLSRNHQLAGYNDSAVVAARIGASKVAALQRSGDDAHGPDLTPTMADAQTTDASGNITGLQMNVEAGEMFELPPGYELSSWNPDYPHQNYESFLKAALRGIAAGLDVATHNLTGDMTEVNYSSARIAEMAEREVWKALQDWFIGAVVRPVFEEWLASALIRGDIKFPVSGNSLPAEKLAKFRDAANFIGRRWSWVDPEKEIRAYQAAIDLRITSRTRIAAEQGYDLEDVMLELAQEEAELKKAGLLPLPNQGGQQGQGGAASPTPSPAPAKPAAKPAD